MSVRSDIEMLSINAVETYAKRNNLTTIEANSLFHKHQIYEKIVLQHEYLHQISFEEVMEFVDKSIAEDNTEFMVFHGTTGEGMGVQT